ncbi:DUF2085 domain-containing protein [Domibacillus antri]|nr:DUF2085 domain-containing protein [Domibacillus antri]
MPCHRRRERSLVVFGKQFPFCYRCMFLLIGLFSAVPMAFFSPILSFIPSLLAGVALNIPMLLDGFTKKKQLRVSSNPLRIITGFLAGFGLAQFTVRVANTGAELILHCF